MISSSTFLCFFSLSIVISPPKDLKKTATEIRNTKDSKYCIISIFFFHDEPYSRKREKEHGESLTSLLYILKASIDIFTSTLYSNYLYKEKILKALCSSVENGTAEPRGYSQSNNDRHCRSLSSAIRKAQYYYSLSTTTTASYLVKVVALLLARSNK